MQQIDNADEKQLMKLAEEYGVAYVRKSVREIREALRAIATRGALYRQAKNE